MSDKQLEIKVEDGVLNISIGVDILAFAILHGDTEFGSAIITDNNGFAKEIVRELLLEEADGGTPVHRMFDKAALNAAENGAEYICFDIINKINMHFDLSKNDKWRKKNKVRGNKHIGKDGVCTNFIDINIVDLCGRLEIDNTKTNVLAVSSYLKASFINYRTYRFGSKTKKGVRLALK